MITFFQEREIEKYLLEKKISGKLLTEIKDHMISQILEIQSHENLNFKSSFERTKIEWNGDLMMVRKNMFSRQKITKIAYKIDKVENVNIFFKSMIFALLFVGFQIILAIILSENWYSNVNAVLKIGFVLLPFVILGMYIKQKRLDFKTSQKNIVINNFVHPLFVFFVTILLDNIIELPKKSYKVFYEYVNLESHGEITTDVFIKCLIACVFLLVLYLFSYFSLKENIKKYSKLNKLYS
ncbi:hypothetical protein J3D55_004585 [Chryseobacterium ginsenosidimutans]|uniref:hypothetical protein n=1 Tax=Chryseobacterium ginsenosidimutans TaxID=687846 RepID=UPI00216A7BA6|nr:hypothetical protein [Chryseobacterium ginsenosidimutans]MCS3871669.1 hypothetical protein [Chryseobacterium ginsenosidimutans]